MKTNLILKIFLSFNMQTMTTIITRSVQNFKEIMKEVEMFGKHAGPKINWMKSYLMKLNINVDKVEGLYFTEDLVKYPGI